MTGAGTEGEVVTHTRRLAAYCLDVLVCLVTFGIGWLIWLAFTARNGQTPGKQLTHVFIHDAETGEVARARMVWLREMGGKLGPPSSIVLGAEILVALGLLPESARDYAGFVVLYVPVAGLWMLANAHRRAVWDGMAGTVVRYHPKRAPAEPDWRVGQQHYRA